MSTEPIVYIVDDDLEMRKSLMFVIETAGFNVQAYAAAQVFLDEYNPDRPGCLILDVKMPGMSGIELQEQLVSRQINLPILFLTGHANIAMVVEAFKAGAVDFMEKPVKPNVMLKQVHEALQRQIDEFRHREEVRRVFALLETLSPREREVLALVVEGRSSKQIADGLYISTKTVDLHRTHIKKKMKVERVADLVHMILTYGKH